jgi:hypothetical protein
MSRFYQKYLNGLAASKSPDAGGPKIDPTSLSPSTGLGGAGAAAAAGKGEFPYFLNFSI